MSCSSPARRRSRSTTGVEAEHAADPDRDLGHAHRVQGRERRLGVDHPRERLGDPVDPLVVGAQDQVARLPARHVGLLERGPERAVAADRQERVDERRVEPAPAAAPRDLRARPSTPPAAWKISTVWARQRIRASSGISSPREAVGLPAAVPVLVERADRGRRLLAEVEHARDLRAAVAARLHELARDLALVADALEPRDALARSSRRAPRCAATSACACHGLDQSTSFDVRLAALVVGAEQRRHPLGVGGAARVLEQQRVEEVRAQRRRAARAPARSASRSRTSAARGPPAGPR